MQVLKIQRHTVRQTFLVARGEEIRLYLQGTNFDAKLKNPPDDKGQGLPKHGIFSV